jgi:hypothetical protein
MFHPFSEERASAYPVMDFNDTAVSR